MPEVLRQGLARPLRRDLEERDEAVGPRRGQGDGREHDDARHRAVERIAGGIELAHGMGRVWPQEDLQGQDGHGQPAPPAEEVSVAELSRKLAELQTKNNEVAQRSLRLQTLTDNIAKCDEAIKELEERIAKIKVDKAGFEKAKADLEATPGEIVPTGDLETQIENAEKTNRLVRLKKQREEKRAEHKAAATTVFESNKRLEEITEAKKKMVKEAKMPIDGLSFDSEGPLFHGIPLAERSSSEQLRVCLAIAKATRKQMAVLIVRDASLLDEDALAEVKQFAEDNDVQILLEVVGEYTGGEAITIEDGMVKELVS